ncbi:MAG: protein kinase [Blastocatellia bacterium]|nr:protein kinase [Blastocatellia bacterium]
MNKDRWQQVEALFHQVLSYAPEARAAYLDEACADDEQLRGEVEALLADEDSGDHFLETLALEIAAQKISDELSTTTLHLPVVAPPQIGPYQLQSSLGKGGMGEVHLALDTRLHRKVAIKLLPAEFTNNSERIRRFAQEARTASALNHPNILVIYDIGEITMEASNTHYIVTEYVEGQTLRQRMTQAPQMELAEMIEVIIQVAAALAAAHEAGIIHRDIKPENVMVRRDGLVKVLDFGLAKLAEPSTSPLDSQATPLIQNSTDTGVVLGTPRYMSPEQARGEKVDARTDIFSLGVMLYEMVAGHAPFTGATVSEIIAAILRDEPAPLAESAAPPELQQILLRVLQKEREARYARILDLLDDLKQLQRRLDRASDATVPKLNNAITPTPARAEITGPNEQAAITTQRQTVFGALSRRQLGGMLAAVLLLAVVAVVVYLNFFQPRAIDSLAVLPFVNVGANPDTEYLSDGVTDDLINKLAQLPQLKVMSRSAVFRYKGKETDAQAAGNALGVRAVLTGKVTQRDDDLLVSAELVDVRDNSHLWGAQYNHKKSDLSAVQAELAREIAEKLRLQLSGEAQQRLTKRGTENAEAYELYLKGRYALSNIAASRAKNSREYFQQAIEKDPRFGAAYAGLAESYARAASVRTASAITPKEAYAKAKDAALKAVELDDTLASAYIALSLIARSQDWDWQAAERNLQRALTLNPNDVSAHHWYSHYWMSQGRFGESLAESQRALALDPLAVGINFHLGWHYYYAHQYEQAVAQLQKTLEISPNHEDTRAMLGLAYLQQGRYGEALAEMQKSKTLEGSDLRGQLGYLYAVSGQRREAQKLLAALQEEAKDKYVSPYHLARIYVGLGEPEQAFAQLEKAFAERDSNLSYLKVEPQFDRLRPDPRFADLLRRIGLAP